MITICSMTFPEFLEKQFLSWQKDLGKRQNIEDFAAYLGVSRPLLTMWMNGSRRPGKENLKLLSAIFGMQVFDLVGLPRPNPLHLYTSRNWENVPEKVQLRIAQTVAKYSTEPIPDESTEDTTPKRK